MLCISFTFEFVIFMKSYIRGELYKLGHWKLLCCRFLFSHRIALVSEDVSGVLHCGFLGKKPINCWHAHRFNSGT